MITLNQPDTSAPAERLAALPRLPRDTGGPVFAEPWEAQAFALPVKLSEQGHFTWKEWASTLADELKAVSDRGEPDEGSHYYPVTDFPDPDSPTSATASPFLMENEMRSTANVSRWPGERRWRDR
jgi:nitrile hydratase accessory protein